MEIFNESLDILGNGSKIKIKITEVKNWFGTMRLGDVLNQSFYFTFVCDKKDASN